jgi:membrane protease YdiL (CAAX protease family)
MPPAPPASWRAIEALPVFLLTIVAASVAGLAAMAAINSCSWQYLATVFAGEAMFALAVLVWVRFVKHAPFSELGLPRRPAWDILLGVLAGGAMIVVAGIVVEVVQAIATGILGHKPAEPDQVATCVAGLPLLLLGPVVVLAAPFGEELFFRGFATTAWTRSIGATPAIVRAAIFFDVAHVLTVGGTSFGDAALRALVAFLTRLPVALALGFVFVRRRSLVASIAVHATFNGVIVLIAEAAARGGAGR